MTILIPKSRKAVNLPLEKAYGKVNLPHKTVKNRHGFLYVIVASIVFR